MSARSPFAPGSIARTLLREFQLLTDPQVRRRSREYRERFPEFQRLHAESLGRPLGAAAGGRRTALVRSSRRPALEVELLVLKTLQLAGFRTVVLLDDEWRGARPYYEFAGAERVCLWSEFSAVPTPAERAAPDRAKRCGSFQEFLALTHEGIPAGTIAASTALRRRRWGTLDWSSAAGRNAAAEHFYLTLRVATQSARVVDAIRPDVVLFWDTEYTPAAEFFQTCLLRGIEAIAHTPAHQLNGLMFKRYGPPDRWDHHPASLSQETWDRLLSLPWTECRRERIARELTSGYTTGDWFTRGTKVGARIAPAEQVRAILRLDPAKKTAVIFAHVLWDAPLLWGHPLFQTYEEWLVETVRGACRNERVNWVLKIHPFSSARDPAGKPVVPVETRALTQALGDLPAHVVVIPPDTDLNTMSLFDVMDYCLTVRGTIGMEAARLGIPVITAAAARYSGKGFTVDSASREEYLSKIEHLHEVPPLSADQRERADRFAYGMFVSRPIVMRSVTWTYGGANGPTGEIHVTNADELRRADDVLRLSEWFQSSDEDLLAGDL